MARLIPEKDLAAIEGAARGRTEGMTAQQIAGALTTPTPQRTLQYRLKHLVNHGRLVKEGTGRWAKYYAPIARPIAPASPEPEAIIPLSQPATDIQAYVRRPVGARKPVGHDRAFLESYRPNASSYLSPRERDHLHEVGKPVTGQQPAGTYARHMLNRLLIDLSWNSSRLEGNTYSLLDTKRLIDFGEEAEGKARLDAQMLLNHKDAIEFLVGSVEDIGFNRHTLLNLHAMLANNLLADPTAPGRLRHIAVAIERSAFHPLEVPQLIDECFNQILATADVITDPFEQALFVMVQLPYLQPFDDVNKRVSRLAANMPLIKGNLCPLSFIDVPRTTYTEAMLGVYELKRIDLLKDVFIWAYERSSARYAAVQQSLGEPDPFRLKHRAALREAVSEVVRAKLNRKSAVTHVAAWANSNVRQSEREQFREMVEDELLGLHEGNFARYRLRPSEFAAWQRIWTETPASTARTTDAKTRFQRQLPR